MLLFYEFVADHHGTWSSGLTVAADKTVGHNGRIYQAVAANTTANPRDDIVANGAAEQVGMTSVALLPLQRLRLCQQVVLQLMPACLGSH